MRISPTQFKPRWSQRARKKFKHTVLSCGYFKIKIHSPAFKKKADWLPIQGAIISKLVRGRLQATVWLFGYHVENPSGALTRMG
jgi:hypothetical protein